MISPNKITSVPGNNGRLAAYAVLAGAVLAAPAVAKADIIWSGMVNLNIASTNNGLYLNVVTGAINEPGNTGGSTVPGWDINIWSSTGLGFFNPANPSGGVYVASAPGTTANLALGSFVDGTNTYSNGVSSNTSQWNLNSSNNYFGFRFLNEATGVVNYGWGQITLSSTAAGQPRALVQFAYDNSGAGIAVGAVPEPSTTALLGLMAVGAVGLRAWRKRKVA